MNTPLMDFYILLHIKTFTGEDYLNFGTVCKCINRLWEKNTKMTQAITKYTTCDQLIESFEMGLKKTKNIPSLCGGVGRIDLIQLSSLNGCELYYDEICQKAAGAGEIGVVRWCIEYDMMNFEYISCIKAAKNGHFEIVKLFTMQDRSRSRSSSIRSRRKRVFCNKSVFSEAAKNGHLEIVKWLCKNGCSWHRDAWVNATDDVRNWGNEWVHQRMVRSFGTKTPIFNIV